VDCSLKLVDAADFEDPVTACPVIWFNDKCSTVFQKFHQLSPTSGLSDEFLLARRSKEPVLDIGNSMGCHDLAGCRLIAADGVDRGRIESELVTENLIDFSILFQFEDPVKRVGCQADSLLGAYFFYNFYKIRF
jgi:hypothetical protein